MKPLILFAALSACASLGGCALNSADATALLKQADTNFQNCDRQINFTAGLGVVTPGAQVTGTINCKAVTGAVAVPAPVTQ